MKRSTDDRVRRVAVLLDENRRSRDEIDWSGIGQIFTEVSLLYQTVKERNIDLILVDDTRTDMTRAVATRIRRYNGLTEIWRLVSDDAILGDQPAHIDGALSRDSGTGSIIEKVDHILWLKSLLEDYQMVGRSGRIKAVAETINRIAVTDMAVLIQGPSGSGKELVSQALHRQSNRSDGAFVAINCGAIAESLLESELFGHEKGAFTGSVSSREGLFHKADGGTIFLDEIGETKADMQVKLLRVLEDGTFYPVGSSQSRHTDVRIISATNRDLADAVADREFREDLFFRIAVIKINVPPLFERRGDIQPLLHHFWANSPDLTYSDGALQMLTKYDWPGNVRQLRNFADRMKAFKGQGLVDTEDVERFLEEQHSSATHLPVATGKTVEDAGQELIYRAIISLGQEVRLLRDLIISHLPSESVDGDLTGSAAAMMASTSMEDMECELIQRALVETNGNRRDAARRLGIGERTLYRKLKKYDLR